MAPSNDQPILSGTTNGTTNGTKSGNDDVNGNFQNGDPSDIASRLFVERSEKAFGSRSVSLVDLPAGAIFAKITTATPSTKAYSSVQISESAHIELNSDLVYINHSCDPNLVFDMARFEVRVVKDKELRKGDSLTFWYPSSEWDMAQPFDCTCGSKDCRGVISGAKDMDEQVLRHYWLNEHIERMLAARSTEKNGS